MRALTAAWLGCLLLVWSGSAQALSLRWSAPVDCMTREQVAARIAALLQSHELPEPDVEVHGRIERLSSEEFALTLEVTSDGRRSTRTLRDRTCAALGEAAAWLVVLAREQPEDPDATEAVVAGKRDVSSRSGAASTRNAAAGTRATRATSDVESSEQTAPQPQDDTERAPAREEPEPAQSEPPVVAPVQRYESHLLRDRFRRLGPRWVRAAAFVGVWQSALPDTQLAVGGRLGVARGALYGELRMQAAPPRQGAWKGGTSVEIASYSLALAGCGQWGERLRIGPCLRVGGVLSDGSVSGITAPKDATVLWLVSELALLISVKLAGPLELLLDGGLGLPLTGRPRFYVTGSEDAVRASLLSAQLSLGVGARWP